MHALIGSILAQAEEHGEEVSEAKDLYPAVGELIVGLLAFAVLFFFTWKWVLPKFKEVLEQRKEQIQGEMEKAEATRKEADQLQNEYRMTQTHEELQLPPQRFRGGHRQLTITPQDGTKRPGTPDQVERRM